MMNILKTKIDFVLKWTLVFLMGTMVINVLWQVFSRFILGNPSSFTEELARYMLIWIGILGAAYVEGQKMHLAIDLLSLKLKGIRKTVLQIFIHTCVFLFALFVMVVGGIKLVVITLSLNQLSAAMQIPLGYVYLIVPVSGLFMMTYSFHYVLEELTHMKNNSNQT